MKYRSKRFLFRSLPLLALALCLILADLSPAAAAVTQADIDALKSDAKDLAQEKKDIQAQIDKLSSDISTTMERKRLLDSQISLTEGEISNKEEEIAVYEDLIAQTAAELADAEAREAAQYELFCKRVRAMEEQGKVEYWSVLFRASSFSDLLGRLDVINEIMEYDQRVIDDLKTLQAITAEKKTELEGQKTASEEAKAELETKKRDLDSQRDAANALVAKLRQQQQEQEDALDDLSADQKRGRYNPFLQAGGPSHLGELQQQCRGSLYLTIGEVERTWQLLRVRHFAPILENILTLGLMAQADRLAEKGAEKND